MAIQEREPRKQVIARDAFNEVKRRYRDITTVEDLLGKKPVIQGYMTRLCVDFAIAYFEAHPDARLQQVGSRVREAISSGRVASDVIGYGRNPFLARDTTPRFLVGINPENGKIEASLATPAGFVIQAFTNPIDALGQAFPAFCEVEAFMNESSH